MRTSAYNLFCSQWSQQHEADSQRPVNTCKSYQQRQLTGPMKVGDIFWAEGNLVCSQGSYGRFMTKSAAFLFFLFFNLLRSTSSLPTKAVETFTAFYTCYHLQAVTGWVTLVNSHRTTQTLSSPCLFLVFIIFNLPHVVTIKYILCAHHCNW